MLHNFKKISPHSIGFKTQNIDHFNNHITCLYRVVMFCSYLFNRYKISLLCPDRSLIGLEYLHI
jgi:hypothetical protein